MTERDEARPVIIGRTQISETTDQLNMSDQSVMYACRWPGCRYTHPTSEKSIPAHYKVHTGKAAQKRRGKRRIHSSDDPIDILETIALSILDQAKGLTDAVDAVRDLLREQQTDREAHDELMAEIAELRDRLSSFLDAGN